MWIISGDTAEDREKLPDILEAVLRDTRAYSETAIADIYEGEMVLFMIGPGNMQDVRALTEAVGNGLAARHIHATLTRCHALNTTTRVREAFLSHQVALSAAKRIFPGQWAYTLEQIDGPSSAALFVLLDKWAPRFFCFADKYIHREARYNLFILLFRTSGARRKVP